MNSQTDSPEPSKIEANQVKAVRIDQINPHCKHAGFARLVYYLSGNVNSRFLITDLRRRNKNSPLREMFRICRNEPHVAVDPCRCTSAKPAA